MKVLFLDRDGIINEERGDYTYKKADFRFTKNLFPFLKSFVEKDYRIIVVTNQGGIDKGIYDKSDVYELHNWMVEELKNRGIPILEVYYCPHHNIVQKCICRKPDSLLIEKAIRRFGIDASQSLMLGDRDRDIESAERAGVRGVLIPSNPDWNEIDVKI